MVNNVIIIVGTKRGEDWWERVVLETITGELVRKHVSYTILEPELNSTVNKSDVVNKMSSFGFIFNHLIEIINDKSVILFLDFLNQPIYAYKRALADWGCTNKIYALLQGGVWEPHDIMTEYTREQDSAEYANLLSVSMAFVQTDYHKELIKKWKPEAIHNVKTIGPLIPTDLRNRMSGIILNDWSEKRGCCYVSRLDIDKGVDIARTLEAVDMCEIKKKKLERTAYNQLLADCKCVFVPTRKETLGLIVMEAIFSGTLVCAPYRYVFPEIYGFYPGIFTRGNTADDYLSNVESILDMDKKEYVAMVNTMQQDVLKYIEKMGYGHEEMVNIMAGE